MTAVTLNAFLPEWSSMKPHELHTVDPVRLASALMFSTGKNFSTDCIRVGTAQVVVTLDPPENYVADAVAGLRAKQAEIRAQAEVAAQRIDEQISKLLAIGHTVEAA